LLKGKTTTGFSMPLTGRPHGAGSISLPIPKGSHHHRHAWVQVVPCSACDARLNMPQMAISRAHTAKFQLMAAAVCLAGGGRFVLGPRRRCYRRLLKASQSEVAVAAVTEHEWHRYADPLDWRHAWDTASEFGLNEVASVEGTIPAELMGGTLYRCGPGRFERGGVRYNHVIDGDGFVYKINLAPKPTALGRFVQTAEFVKEEAADQILFRSSFGTQPSGNDAWRNVFDVRLKNLANTTVLAWGRHEHQRILALFEAGLPYRLDLESLATLDLETFDGELKAGTAVSLGLEPLDQALGFGVQHTAHPHVDPWSERLVGWWSQIRAAEGKARITVREWDATWEPKATVQWDLPTELVPHDFALTPLFYVWCENRMVFTGRLPYLMGQMGPAEGLEVEQGAPNRYYVVARSDSGSTVDAKALVVETPPWFCIHHSHAEEEQLPGGGWRLTIYSAGWKKEGLESGTFLGDWGGDAPDFSVSAPTFYWKTVIGVDANKSSATLLEHGLVAGLESCCMDHPHVDPRLEARLMPSSVAGDAAEDYKDDLAVPHCAYMSYCNDDDISGPPIGWLRVNLGTGERAHWAAPLRSGQFAEEVVVVPKVDGMGSWLLGMLSDARRKQSCLCILDGERIADGPVAKIWLHNQLPHGLHGCFVPPGKHKKA